MVPTLFVHLMLIMMIKEYETIVWLHISKFRVEKMMINQLGTYDRKNFPALLYQVNDY